MSIDPVNLDAPNLIDRAKNILMKPQEEWDRIAAEPAGDIGRLYAGYLLPLVLLAAACAFIGATFIGVHGLRTPMLTGLVDAAFQIIMSFVFVLVLATAANMLAPQFGSEKDAGQAHKLAVYGMTASFLAGVFVIFPPLAVLALAGLYSIGLIYIGLPRLMKTPEDKRVVYLLSILGACLVAAIVVNLIAMPIRNMIPNYGTRGYPFAQNSVTAAPRPEGEVILPGGGSVNLQELQRQAEAMQGGGGVAIPPERLQGYIPRSLPGGFALTSTSSSSAVGAATVEGVYVNAANARLEVSITHMGSMEAIAAIAGAANMQDSQADSDGYTRANTVDGRVVTEASRDRGARISYAIVGRGVAVSVEGSGGANMDDARAAVETIGVQRLERDLAN